MRKSKTATKVFAGLMAAAMVTTCVQPVPVAQAAGKSVTVKTQKQLNSALKNKKVTKITIKTTKSASIAIKKGKYAVKLVVDASKVKLTNSGKFTSVTIKNAKSVTEKADSNMITVTDKSLTLTVAKGADSSKITVANAGSKLKLVANGKVSSVTLTKKATLTVTGKTAKEVKIVSNAKDSKIDTSVKSKLVLNKKTDVVISKGAKVGTVTAKQDADITVAEGATVKTITASGEQGTVTVSADGTVEKITATGTGSTVDVAANGTVGSIDVTGAGAVGKVDVAAGGTVSNVTVSGADSKVDVAANGTVGKVAVDAKASVSVTGTSTEAVKVEATANAKGADITTAAKTDLTLNADVKLNMNAGSEGSTVKTGSDSVNVAVVNNTAEKVTVTNPSGKETEVKAGEQKETNPEQPADPTTPVVPETPVVPGGGGSGSGSGGSTTPTPTPTPSTSVSATLNSTTAKTGDTLTATVTADGFGESVQYSYIWKSGEAVVSSESTATASSTYTVQATDVGKKISVEVTVSSDTAPAKSATASMEENVKAVYNDKTWTEPTISVQKGTATEAAIAQLPSTVVISDYDSVNTARAEIAWTSEDYDPQTASAAESAYTFTGTVTLPTGWTCSDENANITVTAKVKVLVEGALAYTVKPAIREHNETTTGASTVTEGNTNTEAVTIEQNGYNVTITGSLSGLTKFASSNEAQGEGKWIALAIEIDEAGESASDIYWGSASNSLTSLGTPDDLETSLGATAGKRVVVWDLKFDQCVGQTIMRYIKKGESGVATPITVTCVNTDKTVTSFNPISDVVAGTFGDLPSADEMLAKLKQEIPTVTARCVDGAGLTSEEVFTVSAWTNTDSYSNDSNAGEYTFTATLEDKTGVTVGDKTVTVEVEVQKANDVVTFEPGEKDIFYDGSAIAADEGNDFTAATCISNTRITYSHKVEGTDGDFTAALPTNAGTYIVKATSAGDDNYNAGEATATITIKKKQNAQLEGALAATPNGVEGDKTTVVLSGVSCSAAQDESVAIEYAYSDQDLTGDNAGADALAGLVWKDDATFSLEGGKEYYFYARVQEDDNHEAGEIVSTGAIFISTAVTVMDEKVYEAYQSSGWESLPTDLSALFADGFKLVTDKASSDEDSKGAINLKASGELKYVDNFTGFNTEVAGEQKGYYLPLQIAIPEGYQNSATIKVKGTKEKTWDLKENILDETQDNKKAFSILVWISNQELGNDGKTVTLTIAWKTNDSDAESETTVYNIKITKDNLAEKTSDNNETDSE